ncbi:MAG: NfeD family protein [bacterium]
MLIVYLVLKAQLKTPMTGPEAMIGEEGKAQTEITQEGGKVFIRGEIWNALSHRKIKPGTVVKVIDVKGMSLIVEPYHIVED